MKKGITIVLVFTIVGCSTINVEKSNHNVIGSPYSDFSIVGGESSFSSHDSSNCTDDSGSANIDNDTSTVDQEDPYWVDSIKEKVERLNEYKKQSTLYETYCFFTDPHCFIPNRSYQIDYDSLFYNFSILKYAYDTSESNFLMCGGDLLNNADTKSQACFKLSTFNTIMKSTFNKSYFLVGNHDTNYQGDTFIDSGDWHSCMLEQSTINDVLYDGNKSYYKISGSTTSFYCFDSGVEWISSQTTDYQKEQIIWFAQSLLNDKAPYKAILIHIALNNEFGEKLPLMREIEKVIKAFNDKTDFYLYGDWYDYKASCGFVSFIHGGHVHKDVDGFYSEDVPIFLSRTFGSPEIATQPTFDIVFVDYSNSRIIFLRIGDGHDREFSIKC